MASQFLKFSAKQWEISHVVVLSGFVSVELLINSYFGGIMKGYRKAIMQIEQAANPKFVGYNAVESLKNTKAKVLLIYSGNDKMCHKAVHFNALKAGLEGKKNIKLILVKNKGHNPNYTEDAVTYLGEYVAAKTKLAKKGRLNTTEEKAMFVASYDWELNLRKKFGINGIALRQPNRLEINIDPAMKLDDTMKHIVIANASKISKLVKK